MLVYGHRRGLASAPRSGHCPQGGANARQELALVKRLGEVIIRANLQPYHLVHRGVPDSQHDDRQILAPSSDIPAEIQTVEHRVTQVQVEECQVELILA